MPSLPIRVTALAALTGCAALALSACGSSANDSANQAANQQANPDRQAQAARFPGASGKIASVSDSSFLVQNTTAQTRVTYTASTEVTQTRTISLQEVKAGDCVVATGSEASGDKLTAQLVSVSQAVGGECQQDAPGSGPGGGGPGGGRPSDLPSAPPDGNSWPSAPPGAGAGAGSFKSASGRVTGAAADGLVLSGELTSVTSTGPTSSAGSITVNLATNGRVTRQVSANQSTIAVGQCARAVGSADDKGVVAATSINVSAPVDGDCQGRMSGSGSPS